MTNFKDVPTSCDAILNPLFIFKAVKPRKHSRLLATNLTFLSKKKFPQMRQGISPIPATDTTTNYFDF